MRKLAKLLGPVCGVYAITLATNTTFFREVYNYFKCRKPARWKGYLFLKDVEEGLKYFEVEYTPVHKTKDFPYKKSLKNCLSHFVNDEQYLVFVTGHFFTLKQGILYDQSNPEGIPVETSKYMSKRVKAALLIQKLGT